MAAAKMAYEDAGISEGSFDPYRFGCMIGSGIGGLHTIEKQHQNYLERGAKKVSPFVIPMMIANIATGMISIEYGFGGPSMSIVTACATANNSVARPPAAPVTIATLFSVSAILVSLDAILTGRVVVCPKHPFPIT